LITACWNSGSVVRITPQGKITNVCDHSFTRPTGAVEDFRGNIYVANYGGHTIEKITTDGTITSCMTNKN